jgi:hypothetical protein
MNLAVGISQFGASKLEPRTAYTCTPENPDRKRLSSVSEKDFQKAV